MNPFTIECPNCHDPFELTEALAASNLIIMHGHGIPGMSCSVDNRGLPTDLSNKILLTGSCFSAVPQASG